jgi:hypothetical protein
MECRTMPSLNAFWAHHRSRSTPQPLQLARKLVNHGVEVSGGWPAYSRNVTTLNTRPALPASCVSNPVLLFDM